MTDDELRQQFRELSTLVEHLKESLQREIQGLASISTRNNLVTGMVCWAMRSRIRQIA